jgi:hypothetical protein
LKVVDCFLEVFDFGLFVSRSADILDSITKVEVQALVADEIPNLDATTLVVRGALLVAIHVSG